MGDQTNKSVLVLDEALPLGLMLNTAAVLGITLGRKVEDILGPDAVDGSGQVHTALTRVTVPILKGSAAILAAIRERAATATGLIVADVSAPAQQSRSAEEYLEKVARVPAHELTYLGVALYGEARQVARLTGSLPLLR